MAEARGAGGGLRRRLALALIGLAAAAAAVQGIGYWVAERWVERASLQGLLERELEHLVATDISPAAIAANDPTLRYFRPSREALPAPLASLETGWHERVRFDGRDYQALVRDLTPGDRAYLLYDVSALELRERRLILLFGFGVLTIGLLAFWASRRLAARALAPLEALVTEIRALNPETRGARLQATGDPELRVIAEALNGYMRELDALIDRERAFAAAASHELRTPFAVIAGAAEVLNSKPADPSRPLARIERAVKQATGDLDALLALSRVKEPPQARRLILEQVLPEWAEAHAVAGGARIDWQLSPVTVELPPGSLHIVFTNLLRNALRAAGSGGTVTVTLEATGIEILDDGPGIPLDELAHVFEPHFRGRDGGTGIGLYVARALSLRLGWTLTLDNRAASGDDTQRGALARLHWPAKGQIRAQTISEAVSIR